MRKPGYFPFSNPKIPRYVSRSLSRLKRKKRRSMRTKPGWHPFKFRQSSLISSFGFARLPKPFDQTVRSKVRFKYSAKKQRSKPYRMSWIIRKKIPI